MQSHAGQQRLDFCRTVGGHLGHARLQAEPQFLLSVHRPDPKTPPCSQPARSLFGVCAQVVDAGPGEVGDAAVQQGFAETEQLGRTIIRHTVGAADGPRPRATPRRGYRRVEWIERALEPLRGAVPPERFERLVSSLTLVIGWEAMIVLEDTRGLDHRAAEEICVWAARTFLAAETT